MRLPGFRPRKPGQPDSNLPAVNQVGFPGPNPSPKYVNVKHTKHTKGTKKKIVSKPS